MAKFTFITDLRQRHLEKWLTEMEGERPDIIENVKTIPDIVFNGVAIRSAIKAGWFGDVLVAGEVETLVGDLSFAEAKRLGNEVWSAYKAATTIDPN